MMCKRIISVLTFNQGCLYRTKRFHPDYIYTTNFLDFWWADEIVALDVTRQHTPESRKLFRERLESMSKKCFVPLAAGGGIRTLADVDELFSLGVDKVVLNTQALNDPDFITEVAQKYGAQAVVIAIDALKDEKTGRYVVHKQNGEVPTQYTPDEWAKIAVQYGAGEVMVTSMVEDGSLNGYDKNLCSQVVKSVPVPVLVSGGAGNWKHFEQGFVEIGADAVCTTNIYHFTEASMLSAKAYLQKRKIPVRV